MLMDKCWRYSEKENAKGIAFFDSLNLVKLEKRKIFKLNSTNFPRILVNHQCNFPHERSVPQLV